jgi:hypothetical protein
MDSIRIYNRTNWYRWSNGTGGSQIDFLCEMRGMEIKEAVAWLLDFMGYSALVKQNDRPPPPHRPASPAKDRPPFVLPEAAPDCQRLYAYLNGRRRIGIATIDYFVNQGLIYESAPYHNAVFVGRDASGKARFAHMRGTANPSFKCDVAGSDKRYGFNVANSSSTRLLVFEAAIDLMSHTEIMGENEANRLALGMLGDAPIDTFLREHPQIDQIGLFLDRDSSGRNAAAKMAGKYGSLGYRVTDSTPPEGYKDYNDWLVAAKLEAVPRI